MSWLLAPGIVLIVAGFALQFGSYLHRPRPMEWVVLAIRIRFIGLGALFLGIGLQVLFSAFGDGVQVVSLLIGIFLIAMAGTWFYAATDPDFLHLPRPPGMK